MKAIVQTSYGPPESLELVDKETPRPKDNEVLVKIHASSVNAMDWRIFTFPLLMRRVLGGGYRRPKESSCGYDLAGRVEAVGSAVTQFRIGDAVFGMQRGSFAEYVCAPEDKVVLKPATVSFEAVAAVPVAALTALQAVRDQAHVEPGHTVLVNGAGGGVGTFAVQIAKAFGAEVTAVCSTRSQAVARSIGADHVIDYTREDFTKSGRRYDVIIAANGYHSIFDYRRALNPNGVYVTLGGAMLQMLQVLLLGAILSRMDKRRFRGRIVRIIGVMSAAKVGGTRCDGMRERRQQPRAAAREGRRPHFPNRRDETATLPLRRAITVRASAQRERQKGGGGKRRYRQSSGD